MVKAVVFDMFETLVSLYRTELYFGEHMCKDMGLTEEKFRKYWDTTDDDRSTGVKRFEDTIKEILEKNNIFSEETYEKVVRKRYESRRRVFKCYREDIKPMLQAIRDKGVKVALITNCFSEEAVAIKESDLFEFFDVPVLSFDEGVMKPDLEIYRRALKRLGVEASECLYVGDGGSHELQAAKEIGMKPLQALWYFNENIRTERKPMPEFIGLKEPADVLKYLDCE